MLDSARYYLALVIVVTWPAGLVFWFMIHPFVDFWRKLGPRVTYAVTFSAMAIVGAALFRIRHVLLSADYGTNYFLIAAGAIVFIVSSALSFPLRKQLPFRILVGLPEIDPKGQEQRLLTSGLFARVRNPRYVAMMLFGLSMAPVANYPAVYVVVGTFIVGLWTIVLLEEKELRARFGKAYDEYCKRVPRFIPKL